MAQEPRISVIICCYNDGKYLRTALASLRQQRLPKNDYRVVVVDDGSTDDTFAICQEFKDCLTLDSIAHESNRGLPAACNTGLHLVDTDYFLRLDADDRLSHTALTMLLKRMERSDTDLVFSDRMDNDQYVDLSELPRDYPFYFARTLQRLVAGGILFKTQMVKDIGGYNDLFWEEFDLLIRYLAQSRRPLGYVPRALYHYTRRKDSMTKGIGTISGTWESQEWKRGDTIKTNISNTRTWLKDE